jgi:hypothetical protein
VNLQEVARPNRVVAQESLPGLTIPRWSYGEDVTLECRVFGEEFVPGAKEICAESHPHARRTNRLGYGASKALDALPNGSAQTEGEVAEPN